MRLDQLSGLSITLIRNFKDGVSRTLDRTHFLSTLKAAAWVGLTMVLLPPSGFGQSYTVTTYVGASPSVPEGGVLNHPAAISLDNRGSLFILETQHGAIRRVGPEGLIETFATLPEVTLGSAIVADADGHLFVSPSDDGSIYKIDSKGNATTVVGNDLVTLLQKGEVSKNASAQGIEAAMSPVALALDAGGNLFIADIASERYTIVDDDGNLDVAANRLLAHLEWPEKGTSLIRKFSSGGTIKTIAGNDRKGFSGDGGPATAASLDSVTGLAFDSAGNLYIADSGNCRVRKVNPAGIITTIAGNGKCEAMTDAQEGGSALAASFFSIGAIALDDKGNIYIADDLPDDRESPKPPGVETRIRRITPEGSIRTIVDEERTPVTVNSITDLQVDKMGAIYVSGYYGDILKLIPNAGPRPN